MKAEIKAISLFSGGLDSVLAAKLMMTLGVHVVALKFDTGFFQLRSRRAALRDGGSVAPGESPARVAAREIGADFREIDISREYIEIVLNPRYGYGRNVNPCIDCKIMMLRRAKELMEELGVRFVVTGEVLGQRPMSQHRSTLNLIEKESGLRGILLRPLSARLLKPTVPELEGWVERDKLLDISGRSRKPQIRLAQEFGIHHYAQPAGGCFLTDENYARRLDDLFRHKGREAVTVEDLRLMMYGRQFRISGTSKAVVGRDEIDNRHLEEFVEGKIVLQAADFEGPLTLIDGEASPTEVQIAAQITARYCDGKSEPLVNVLTSRGSETNSLAVSPINSELLERMRI